MLAWALACVFVAWAVVFTLHGSIHLAVAVLAVIAVVALIAGRREPHRLAAALACPGLRLRRRARLVALARRERVVGDGLFHEARVRKLVELTSLHLRTVDEFKDGGLHPGYAFPLWHGFLALVSKFSGLDPGVVMRHEASLLAPLACLRRVGSGRRRLRLGGGRRSRCSPAQLGARLLRGGARRRVRVARAAATAARQLLVPAAIALFFVVARRGAARGARRGLRRAGARPIRPTRSSCSSRSPRTPVCAARVARVALALAAAVVPTALVLLWLRPLVNETRLAQPERRSAQARGLAHYGDAARGRVDHHFRLAAEVFGRSGAVAVAALLLLPLAALALRRRWAAFALGGSVSSCC